MNNKMTVRGGAGDITEADLSARPQDKLYLAVNSEWLKNAKIPSDRSRTSSYDGIELKIKDYGIGIAEEKIPYIFDRFYRVDEARSQSNNNFGLGLAIAKRICSYYGYEISVESTINEYTIFTIIFEKRTEK